MAILGAVVIMSGWLRFSHSDWDSGYQLHPDERAILFVAQDIHLPQSLDQAVDVRSSPLNPYRNADGNPQPFAYGTLPLYLNAALQRAMVAVCRTGSTCQTIAAESFGGRILNVAGLTTFDQLTYTGRALSALFDTLTVAAAFLLALALLESRIAALMSASMVALAVIHIQNAHFGTVDTALAFWCTLTLWLMVNHVHRGLASWGIAAGISAGLAAACKLTGALLILPVLAASIDLTASSDNSGLRVRMHNGHTLRWMAAAGVLAFIIGNPFAVLDIGAFTDSAMMQASMVIGASQPDFTLQYAGTIPILYSVDQMARWGLGLPLTAVSVIGLVWSVRRALLERSRRLAVVVIWVVLGILLFSSGNAKFPRYLLPVIPALCVIASGFIVSMRGISRGWMTMFASLVLLATALNALAFQRMYDVPHPWIAASRWLYENIPTGSSLLDEAHDDALPLDMAPIDGGKVRNDVLETGLIDPLAAGDDCARIGSLASQLNQSDFVIIASNRRYGIAARLSERFSVASAYYQTLFAGLLGFEMEKVWYRYPNIAGVQFIDDPASDLGLNISELTNAKSAFLNVGPIDESSTVYDHPVALLFRNRQRFTEEKIGQAIRAQAGCTN